MPVMGTRKTIEVGKGYLKDPISEFASEFRDLARNILNEGTDLFSEPSKALMLESSNEAIRRFFVENSADRNSMTADEYEDHIEMMNEQYLNNREAINEYASIGQYNPVIGMSFPLHKNILMNCIYDKGAIPKAVAVSPKFTISMETRILTTPDGKEIDMFKDQMEITSAINSTVPVKEVEITLPEYGQTDVLDAIGADTKLDNLSIETHISAVQVAVEITKKDGQRVTEDKWIEVEKRFKPGYGEFGREFTERVDLTPYGLDEDVLNATMHKNRFTISSLKGIIKAVKLKTRKDTSNGLTQTCSVKWSTTDDLVEIPSAIPVNTAVSPEEVKDISALYNVNQLSKIMSMLKLVMENYKDDSIREKLDESFKKLPDSQKVEAVFDFAPREGYSLDHVEWRHKTFFDALDTHVEDMLAVLNDPNMTVTIFGRPDLIRKITPTEYSYQSPQNIGPVELNYDKTVVTSNRRVYHFMSSSKLKDSDELTIILCPRNSNRIVYRIYDYQMYVSNEIRNSALHTLPAIHAFERWAFKSYQPVQGRIEILNPTGLR